jgi:ABC-type uncharacterized transport system permease subunit
VPCDKALNNHLVKIKNLFFFVLLVAVSCAAAALPAFLFFPATKTKKGRSHVIVCVCAGVFLLMDNLCHFLIDESSDEMQQQRNSGANFCFIKE